MDYLLFCFFLSGIVQELKGVAEKYAAFGVGEHFERVRKN